MKSKLGIFFGIVLGVTMAILAADGAKAAIINITAWAQTSALERNATAPTLADAGSGTAVASRAAHQGDLRANLKTTLVYGDTATYVDRTTPMPVSLTTNLVAGTISGTASISADNVMFPATASLRIFSITVSESAGTPALAQFTLKTPAGAVIYGPFNVATASAVVIPFGDRGASFASGLLLDQVAGEASFIASYRAE